MALKNQIQLITYPDSLGGDLQSLHQVLNTHFEGLFKGGIHILPPYPSSGDRGFAPLTYLEIEPKFGNWDNIRQLAQEYDLLLDLMVNHISRQSVYFQDFLQHGQNSVYADLFIGLSKIWPDGKPNQTDIEKIFLRRMLPWSIYQISDEKSEQAVWTTFGKEDPSEQIDLDINSPSTRQLLSTFFENFSKQNIKTIRLDAVGYVVKKTGTSCFFVEPEIYEFLDWLSAKAKSLNLELLPEVHAHYSTQFALANRGFWIYDFILPYVILEALINKTSERLKDYLMVRPHKQITMLDCHDGIPVKPDLDGLIKTAEARLVVDTCLQRGANLSKVYSEKHKDADGFDVHQIRCTYYSALDHNDDAYIAARALQFFTPGVPQVYYVGLLAGQNDLLAVSQTGEGREINRHNYSLAEIEEAITKPVVKRLFKLIRFRNEHPAFYGTFSLSNSEDTIVKISWEFNNQKCSLNLDLNNFTTLIAYTDKQGNTIEYTA